ncbi:hypothetical protein [Pseudomonas alabamensis]|uniref:hypothetical protein n=1 Tax=Pseudomonas alabamensis TaxID=3064349 RepID=UPI003F6495AA
MNYTPNPQHRNSSFSAQKSQWTITVHEEIECFTMAADASWFAKDCYWGLCPGQSSLRPVGMAPPPHSCPVHFAKFVGDTLQNWHGYPIAHWVAPYDKPPEVVLKGWQTNGIISKPQFARILRGKKCAL